MEYQFVINIGLKEYEEFVFNHKTKSHFMQSYYFGEISKTKGFIPHYVGIKNNDKLIATALLLEKKVLNRFTYFYSPRGFVLDYSNTELVRFFTNSIRKYIKQYGAFFIAIDPDIKLQQLDIDGNVIDEKNNNYQLINELKNMGYKHLGFNKNFENREPRYTFRLNLSPTIEEIHKNMHATTRKILNKGNQYKLEMYIGKSKDLKDFYFTMEETGVRENIKPFPFKYYQNFYNIFNKNNMSDLYIVKVKISYLIKQYEEKIKKVELDIKNLDNLKNKEKSANLSNEYNNQLKKLNQDLKKIKEIKETELTLSSIITVKYGNKIWTVHGGNCNKLRELNANYLIYDAIICDAKKNGFEIIDFFGTTGADSIDNAIHGIHLFKKRLGGEYTEFVGEFHLITNKFIYFLYTKLLPLYRKIKKNKH